MTDKEFDKAVAAAIKGLPKEFRARLDNVAVVVSEAPSREQERRFGRGLLGLYEGVPLPERGTWYSGAMPDKITLFKRALEEGSGSPRETERRIRHTIMHEIAHHFGMDDEELIEKGLY